MARLPPSSYDPNSTPTSDPDPFSSPSPSSNSFTTPYRGLSTLPASVSVSSLPKSLPLLGSLTGYTEARRIRIINERLHTISTEIKRPLTPEEENALAWHTAKGLSTGSWGPTVGIALGLARWWQTWADMRWLWLGKLKDNTVYAAPGEQAASSMSTSAAGSGSTPPPAGPGTGSDHSSSSSSSSTDSKPNEPSPNTSKNPKGPAATPKSLRWDGSRLWAGSRELLSSWDPVRRSAFLQGSRALPYIGLGWILATLFIGTYAGSVVVVGEITDPRLRSLTQELRKAIQIKQGALPPASNRGNSGAPRGQQIPPAIPGQPGTPREREPRDIYGQGTRNPGELWRSHRQAIERSPNAASSSGFDGDDASPSSDTDAFVPDTDTDSNPSPYQTSGSARGRSQWDVLRNSNGRNSSADADADSDSDDASPTGGRGAADASYSPFPSTNENANTNTGRSGGSGSGNSTWDRIRAQARSSPAPSDDGSGSSRSTVGDFTFSKSEEERSLAQEEAQRDFDARVERERQGRDFGGRGGRGGRW